MRFANKLLIGAIAAALLQTVALASMFWPRYRMLETGKEVVLQSRMVDPRDLFRGHYTRLNLTAGELKFGEIEIVGELDRNEPVFVELKPGDGIYWVASRLHAVMPESPQGPVLAASLTGMVPAKAGDTYRLSFPFDRFFAPKERALELESESRERNLGVIIAVGGKGEGIIKGITVDDRKIYSEKVF